MLSIWLLLVYGITLILTGSRITEPVRRFVSKKIPGSCYFVQCPMCVGWWIGLGLALLEPRIGPLTMFGWPRWGQALGEACMASAACWVVHVVLAKLGAEEL